MVLEKINEEVYIFRERLDRIEPRFRTKWTNLFILEGEKAVAVVDTGSGLVNLAHILQEQFPGKEALVFNTHNHFDHVGGNMFFKTVYIHKLDLRKIVNGVDITFLEDSETEHAKKYSSLLLGPPEEYIPLVGGESFDLGGIKLTVVHTPGHTYGSICIATSNGDVFTGDAFHKGAYYLPEVARWGDVVHSLQVVSDLQPRNIYPGHEEIDVSEEDIQALMSLIKDANLEYAKYDKYLDSYVLEHGEYSLIFPIS